VVHRTENRFNLDEVVRSTEIGVLGAMVSLISLSHLHSVPPSTNISSMNHSYTITKINDIVITTYHCHHFYSQPTTYYSQHLLPSQL
jgi:hypothetical protein